jgi:hypothetical protein
VSRGAAIRRFFEDLFAGDLVAWGFVGFFVVVAVVFGLIVLKVRRDLRRQDEEWKRRHRGGRDRQKKRMDRTVARHLLLETPS